jgi:hypothetical protein
LPALELAKLAEHRHFVERFLGQQVPVDAARGAPRPPHLDHRVRGRDDAHRQVVRLGRKPVQHLQRMHRGCHRDRRVAELAEDRVLEIGVAVPLAEALPAARHCN